MIKNNSPLVSVIIPVYNRRGFCQGALKLLRAQTLQNIEFIIVDDGSTDGSYKYLTDHTKSDKRFKIFKLNKNSGPSVARNLALKHARGKYIGFFDIDDEIPADYFESLLNTATKNKSDIVFTSHNNIPHEKIGNIRRLSDKIGSLHNGALWDKLFATTLIKRHNISFPIGRYCADNVFVFTAFYYAKRITLCNQPVYKYILRQDSIGIDAKKQEKRKVDAIYIAGQLVDFINKHDFDDASRHVCINFLTKSLNSYTLDADFNRKFQELIYMIQPRYTISQEARLTMIFLKLMRMLRIITKQKYEESVLMHQVKRSGLFDGKWYLQQNHDVKRAKKNPMRHYLNYGWREGRNPSQCFDNNAYLRENSDVAAANTCPLVHYIKHGIHEGRVARTLSGGVLLVQNPIKQKIQHALEYPIRVRNEYHRLKDEIRNLKNGK